MADLETKITESQPADTVLDLYAERQRYFMGDGSFNNALSQLAADLKTLDGGSVIPGFQYPIAKLFALKSKEQ